MGLFDNKYLAITLGDFEFDYSKKGEDPHASLMSVIRPKQGSSLTLNKALATSISPDLGKLIPGNFSISIKDVLSASYGTTSVLNASFGAEIDLTSFPILKDFLPSGEKISINSFQLLLSTGALTKSGSKAINSILPPGVAHLPSALKKGFSCTASLQIGNELYSLDSSGSFNDMTSSGNAGAKKSAKINPVNKKLGPVGIGGVSLGMHNGEIALTINGALSLGPVGLEFIEFTASTPLDTFNPTISLKGLSVELNQPPVSLDGMFENKQPPGTGLLSEYYGKVFAAFNKFSVLLEGSYAQTTDGSNSVYLFGVAGIPMAGPPFLYIEDVAAGFGYNRGLTLPDPNDVTRYAFVEAINNPDSLSTPNDSICPIDIGSYWGVAGLRAGSFKMIDNTILLAFKMDRELEVDIIGYSDMKFPKPKDGVSSPEVLAELKIGYVARFLPDRGVLSVSGSFLPGSYIYNPFVHISGGFALLSIFKDQDSGQWKGASAGDFIFTIGGYAKNYSVQSYYPKVPRLQMNWAFSSDLYIKAQAYFAITPNAMMAGGWLDANFQEGGDLSIHVHFTCGADFIIYWKPYHYSGEIYANLHVSARVSIDCWLFTIHIGVSFDLGADLQIWGPSFAGHASIHVHVLVSFTVGIGFGDSLNMPPPALNWSEFSTSFLPHKKDDAKVLNVISGQITNGLISSKSTNDYLVVNKKEVALRIKTVIPIRTCLVDRNPMQILLNETYEFQTGQSGGTWSIEDKSIASIDQQGKLTGGKIGSTTASYTYLDKDDNKNIPVTKSFQVFVVNPQIGIKPMQKFDGSFSTSELTINITKDGGPFDEDHFEFSSVSENVPAALWQPDSAYSDHLVKEVTTGFDISVKKPTINEHSFTVPAAQVDILSGGTNTWATDSYTYSSK